MALIVDKWVSVGEWQSDVDTNVLLKNGDWVDIAAQGTIWAGVWFTGSNTARGWEGWTAGNDKPLPGSPPFCLLGRTSEDGYFYIGDGIRRTYQNATLGPGETRLSLRINDNLPGNGSGAFNVHIMVWRNPDAVISLTPAGAETEQTLFDPSPERGSSAWARETSGR
ncbi:MAG TPA: hypothetical protein VI357_16200 [Mycobacteriales bacterium]